MTANVSFVGARDRKVFWMGGQRQSLIIGAKETAGRYALSHASMEAGGGAAEHRHGREAEAFYILSGRLRLTIGGQDNLLGPGDFIHVEPGTPYGFVAVEPTEVLVIYSPAGLETFIAEAGVTEAENEAGSEAAAARSMRDIEAMKTSAGAYGLSYTDGERQ